MRRLIYFFLLCASIAQAQPTPTGNTKIRVVEGNNTWYALLSDLLGVRPSVDSTFAKISGSYTGKRITDNVYRYGTIGVRTNDTTGVSNIKTRTGKTGEVITADTSGNGTLFLSLKPPSFSNQYLTHLQPFNFYAQRFVGANSPLSVRPNYVWGMGYNLGTNGARLNTHEAAGGIHFETYFQNAALGGSGATGMTEFHLFTIDTAGNTNRFFSNVEPWDGRRDASQVTIKTDKFSFNDRVNSAVWQHNPLTNLWNFSDTTALRFDEARGFGLSVLNGAANAYLSVLDFNGTDTLEVARQNTPGVKIHPNLILNNGQVYAGAGSAGAIKLGSNTAVTQLNVFGNTSVGSSSLGARLFIYNDNSSTSAASADSWAVMHLRNRNSTNNNWSAIQFNNNTGTIAADMAVQYVSQTSAYGDIVFHNRGSSTGFGEAFRITSEKLIRVPTLGTTPTVLVGRNSSNELSSTSLSSEITIASGTLKLAQQAAVSGQVLEWNGSAWAPATDDTGSGLTGSGASPQVAYWSGASALTGNSAFLYEGSILKVKNNNALTGFLNNDAQQNIQLLNTDATNNNWSSITNYTSSGTVNAALAFQNVDQTTREAAVDIWGYSTSSFLRLARFKHDGITLDRATTVSGAATFSSTAAFNGAATFSAGITANTSASNFNSQINSGSSSIGNIAYFWNDYSSTSAASSNAFASIVLKNRNSTANNWTALEWDSQTGQIAGSVSMQYLDHTNDYGDLVFHTRGSGTAFGEALRVTSEKRVGIGTSAPASKLDVEGGVSIGATYSGTTAAPTNGAIIEGNVGIGNNAPGTRLHVTTGSGATTAIQRLENTTGDADIFVTNATPESAITGNPGDIAIRTDAGNGKIYVKGSGTGNTGWVDQSAGGGSGTPAGSDFQVQYNNGGSFGAEANFNYDPTNDRLSVGYTTPAATLHARGNSTTVGSSVLGENSSGDDVFKVNNNGTTQWANNETYPYAAPSVTTDGSTSLTATGLTFKGQLDATSGTDMFGFTHANNTITSGTFNVLKSTGTFSPSSGSATYTGLRIDHTVNQTGGANGITRGLYVNPTLTAASDYRGVETNVASGTTRWGYYGAGTADSYFGGKVQVETLGSTSTALVGRNASKELSSVTNGVNIALNSGTLDVMGNNQTTSQYTGDQDNLSPSNWSSRTTHRISGDGTIRAITGFTDLPDGTVRRIVNVGSSALYIPAGHPDSDVGHRVAGRSDQILAPGGIIEMYYSGPDSMWQITSNTFNPANMMDAGVLGHYYSAPAGSTVAADWGALAFQTNGGANGQTAPTSTLPGAWTLNSSTSATGSANLYYSDGLISPVETGAAHLVSNCAVYIPTLSDGTQTFTAQFSIGATPNSNSLNNNNAVGIRYSNGINSGKFEGFSRNNSGTESTVDLGVTVAANTNYVLTICFDKARTEARFYINGAYSGRVTGNMPNAVDAGPRVGLFKSAGTTAREIDVAMFNFYSIY